MGRLVMERARIVREGQPVADRLAEALSRGDSDLAKVTPVLSHLLGNADHALFSDEVVARVKGMLSNMAHEFAAAELLASGSSQIQPDHRKIASIASALAANNSILAHCHASAIEWQLTTRLEVERALDPVLSPLVQALIASSETATSSLGMAALSAQARFAQSQRRMELAASELPPDLFHEALEAWRAKSGPATLPMLGATQEAMRQQYDPGKGRIALLERLVVAMGKGVTAALSIEHAGVALFLSALSAASGHHRDRVILATNESQAARLLLALRSTGLKPQAVDEQLVFLHRSLELPVESSSIDPDTAAVLLQNSRLAREP